MQRSSPTINLLPATLADIPILATVSHAAFAKDKHTHLKALRAGYDHGAVMTEALASWMSRPASKCTVIKAVTSEGEIVGWACWAFAGFEHHAQSPIQDQSSSKTSSSSAGTKANDQVKKHESTTEMLPPPPAPTPADVSERKPAIQRLGQLTSAAMSHYASLLTPSGSKCVILAAINVSPSHQSLGIGSSLITWGARIADTEGVYSWVSSSHDGYRAFEKCGFREVGRLSVVLDDYAEGVACDLDAEVKGGEYEGDGKGKWGEYVWRYMRREVGAVVIE